MTATATRTDIHRPSAADFDPEGYEYVGAFDLHPEDGNTADRMRTVRSLVGQGITFAGVHPTGQCDHCGAHIRYEGMLVHTATRKIVTVGEQCLDNRFFSSAAEFKILRAAAAAKAKATREAHARNETALAAIEWLTDADPTLVELTYAGNGGTVDGNYFLADLARSLFRYGKLTEGQERAAVKSIGRDVERANRADQRRREAEARKAAGTQAPEGRVAVDGLIQRTWTQESDYGTQFKMRVVDDRGFVVISTIPAKVLDAFGAEHPTKNHYAMTELLAGRRVQFTAALERTKDDETAAWAKRPTKAILV